MATKGKSTKKSESTVVRVRASDDTTTKKTTAKQPKRAVKAKTVEKVKTKQSKNPLRSTGGYFKGAWQELRQVRWPNRQATWSMTAALLVFTAFFVALILLLDALFKYIFQLILG